MPGRLLKPSLGSSKPLEGRELGGSFLDQPFWRRSIQLSEPACIALCPAATVTAARLRLPPPSPPPATVTAAVTALRSVAYAGAAPAPMVSHKTPMTISLFRGAAGWWIVTLCAQTGPAPSSVRPAPARSILRLYTLSPSPLSAPHVPHVPPRRPNCPVRPPRPPTPAKLPRPVPSRLRNTALSDVDRAE